MHVLLRIDLVNKQYTVVWQQPGARRPFHLLQSGATQRSAPTGREVHGALIFKNKSVLYNPAHFQMTLPIRNYGHQYPNQSLG